jgi:hypothetical protein
MGRTITWLKVVRIHFNWLSLATMNTGIGTHPPILPPYLTQLFQLIILINESKSGLWVSRELLQVSLQATLHQVPQVSSTQAIHES